MVRENHSCAPARSVLDRDVVIRKCVCVCVCVECSFERSYRVLNFNRLERLKIVTLGRQFVWNVLMESHVYYRRGSVKMVTIKCYCNLVLNALMEFVMFISLRRRVARSCCLRGVTRS